MPCSEKDTKFLPDNVIYFHIMSSDANKSLGQLGIVQNDLYTLVTLQSIWWQVTVIICILQMRTTKLKDVI